MPVRKRKQLKNLAAGRPPTIRQANSISRKATRTLINSHHTLEKRKRQAIERKDLVEEAAINTEIDALGGLEKYQWASLQGQRNDRGGDSSKILLEWLKPDLKSQSSGSDRKLRMLEIGALSTTNACSRSGLFDMTCIDLRSQEPDILEQDFMKRPLPENDSGRFDVISLSLVLNFVPTPAGRGEMLRRTACFLRDIEGFVGTSLESSLPALFVVLPRPCVSNSRYFSDTRFDQLMAVLGYSRNQTKLTEKLAYSLWRKTNSGLILKKPFPKKVVQFGNNRNNFSVVLLADGFGG
jgi:25S rRNA (adenine2142-N1)-methyltransferase